ncbi:DUF2797 domain-containing protein [Putridiphycobacter roseus]|uniref:DUF2797 domain-containing protein n=1 Tax=Putridiphycobacter roseus TaxID=2219161 RepID=A0A2W1MVF4_9FLAO|nr:DUF2797 domain-containing protein [Putridiphycobacter roseus]PZE15797.1 DUF2797 domain-containing protein [Putridiphycobacter roseus]
MEILLHKMHTKLEDVVQYSLQSGAETINMNALIGQDIRFTFKQNVQCGSCGKNFKKLFAQGFCYNCFMSVPEAAECIIKPELCRAHLGEGRDVAWEIAHHMQPHFVYFAVASSLKVGVTRTTQVPTRWIDQGASQAIRIAETPYRQLAGQIEVALKSSFTDKTNWRRMLKNEIGSFDLETEKWQLEELLPADLSQYMTEDDEIIDINYPVLMYPEKVTSVGFDKLPVIEGQLLGIKGQYLILDNGRVLNIRKHEGYIVDFDF